MFGCFQYMRDLESPLPNDDRSSSLDWLLGYSIRLEYGDNSKCAHV